MNGECGLVVALLIGGLEEALSYIDDDDLNKEKLKRYLSNHLFKPNLKDFESEVRH